MSGAITTSQLARSYGDTRALDGVSFSLPRGSLCGLVGPNGAGKTTLLSILATLDEDFEGSASVAGIPVEKDPLEARKRIGFVPDQAALYEQMTARELLAFFASANGVHQRRRQQAIDSVIDLCALESILDRPAAGLSKGQTQRLCVGRALLHDPDVLLLDEPASGLDPRARIELKELLKKLAAQKKTVLISSHILTELGDFCDSVIVMEHGRVVADGLISDLMNKVGGSGAHAPRRVLIEVDGDVAVARIAIEALRFVRDVAVDGNLISCVISGGRAEQVKLSRAIYGAGCDIVSLVPERANLEALFLVVTGVGKGES